jgi:hypothetical protein
MVACVEQTARETGVCGQVSGSEGGGVSRVVRRGKKEKKLVFHHEKGEAGTRRAATQGGKPARVRRKGYPRTEMESFFFLFAFSLGFLF